MSRFELTVSPNYVPEWTEVEAIRELFQNALDSPGKMSWSYNSEQKEFTIESADVSLTKESLLFGSTTKADDKGTIGNFGEGYKLAFLVLARLGHKITVLNPKESEEWAPKIIKSRRYGSDLLVVDVYRRIFLDKTRPLTFIVEGITQEMFDEISIKNLDIKPVKFLASTQYGDIIDDPKYKGQIFINGLYVCTKKELQYGYNAQPKWLETNRDRNLVSDFNITWLTSQIWGSAELPKRASAMVRSGDPDVAYIDNYSHAISDTLYAEFIGMYGKYAVPVTTQKEFDLIRQMYKRLKPIFVKPVEKEVIYKSCWSNTISNATERVNTEMPEVVIAAFFKRHKRDMRDKARVEFKKLVELSRHWTFK